MHPGPFWLGTTNPSGLRGKESTYFDLPTGLWGVSETHLTQLGQRSASAIIRRQGQEDGRQLQIPSWSASCTTFLDYASRHHGQE